MRFVFDTNVLINGFDDDFSAPAKLINAVRDGEITALVTHKIGKEYRLILRRLINDPTYTHKIQDFLDMAEEVKWADTEVVIDDREDYKFIQAAVGGKADAIVTSDRHLLDVGEVDTIRMITPQEAWVMVEEEGASGGGAWNDFIKGLRIGR